MFAVITENIEDDEGGEMFFASFDSIELADSVVEALGDIHPNMFADTETNMEYANSLEKWPTSEFDETMQLVADIINPELLDMDFS